MEENKIIENMDKFIFRKEYYEVLKDLSSYNKKDVLKAIFTYCFDYEEFENVYDSLLSDVKPIVNLITKLIEKDDVSKFYDEAE